MQQCVWLVVRMHLLVSKSLASNQKSLFFLKLSLNDKSHKNCLLMSMGLFLFIWWPWWLYHKCWQNPWDNEIPHCLSAHHVHFVLQETSWFTTPSQFTTHQAMWAAHGAGAATSHVGLVTTWRLTAVLVRWTNHGRSSVSITTLNMVTVWSVICTLK